MKPQLHWNVGILFIFALETSFAQYNPLRNPNTCGRPICKGGSKFKYRPEIQHIYSYTVDVASLFNGTSQNESTLHIESTVKLRFISECEGILSVSDVTLSDNPNAVNVNDENEEDMDVLHHANSDIFSDKLSECNLRFSFQDGLISEICPCEEEENWVLNFKRGLLSIFQNTMKRIDLDYTTWEEEDVHGKCETTYTITGTKETNLLLTRTKDLKSCQSGSKLHSFLQSTPYSFKSVNERQSIITSTSVCKISIDHNIYNEVVCEEIHKFEPFSNNAAGASTAVKQTLSLQSEAAVTLEEQSSIIKRTNLLYDQVPTPKPTSGELKASRDALRQLCKLNTKDFQAQFSDIFTAFIHTSRLLSYVALSSLYGHAGIICQSGKKHMLDALPHLGSSAGVTLMKDIILNGSISEGIMHDWMNSMAFISRPNEAMMETASQILIHKGDDFTVVLSVTALAHTFCKQNRNCFSSDPIHQITKLLENRVSENSESKFDVLKHDNILISMKGLANVGIVSRDFKNTLHRIIENNNIDVSIRLAAIEIFIRLPCEENRRRFEDIFRNQTEDVEVRIASYLQVMRCPNYIVMRTIQHSLEVEEVNQVGSFVWSHLRNLLKTSVPNRVEIQSLLSDNNLKKKFSNDVRKFSHNYEGSIFFEEYNMGGSFESDVIFSPSSYVPKTANLNLTVDMFGESINIFEFNTRVDGFEHYLESLFGPRGPWNAKNVQDKIPKMRWPRSSNYDQELISKTEKISQTYSNPRNNPKVSLGLKMFGNNMKYAIFNGEQEIKEAVRKLNPENYIKRLISGKEINYNKAMMFMDSSYIVPTGAGFPMVLNSIGTVSVNVKMFGNLQAENFSKTKALDLIAEFRPSAAVDIVGSMSVDAFYASTAIKLKTNVHTSTALESKLKIRGTDLISMTFTTPNQKTDIFGARSELIVVNGGVETRQNGIEGTKFSSTACVWPTVEEAIGLKLCTNYYYPNVTKIESAPYFILAGPSEYSLSLEKTDPSIKSYVFVYKWDKTADANAISVTFDTPGSGRSRLLNANITFDAVNNDISLVINSPGNVLTAHGKYRNTEDEKYIQMTLNVNNRKRFDASLSLKKLDGRNGYTYLPKAYLGVNGERVAEIQGTLKWVSKKGVGQCDVDLKFHTKRLTSQLFGYLSKTDASIGSNLKLYYKFVNTQEQRAALEILLANRSTRTLTALLGDLRLETTNYPHFNFESALKFQRAAGRLEGKFDVEVGAYTKAYKPNDPNRMKIVVEVRHKATSGGARFETKVMATKPSTDLNVGAEFSYSVIGPNTDMNALVKYAKDKQAAIKIFWSQPRGSLEFFEGQLNVTLTGYSSSFLHVRVEERHSSHYNVDLNAAWFSGHTINVHGIYQDKSTVKTSNHHLKIIIKSPHFSIIAADCQFYQDDVEFKIDVEANQANNDYGVYYKHSVFSLFDISTEGKIKYNNRVYSVTSSVNLRDRKQLLLEFHFDRFRDIHLELWNHNKEFHKTGGFEIKWDANRDPNQKLIATIEFRNPELYNYVGNFVISYPGRAINGVFEFFAKDGHFLTRSHITWSPIHKIAFSISTDFKSDVETLFVIKSELITPLEDWRKNSFNACYYHKRNMYSMNSSTHWHNNQHISIDLLRDYEATDTFIGYELKSALHSTIQNFPSFTVSAKHKQDSGKVETNLYTLLNPKNVFGIKSLWLIHENKNVKNLTGMVTLVTPFAGYNKGLLISKVYVINKKYVRGVADLDLDHKKYTVSVEGHYKKFTDNMFVFNVTTPKEKYKMITGKLGFLEEQKYLVGLVQYPTGKIGLEIKLNFNSLQKFDVIIYAATPIEFLETVLVVGKLNQEEADFRLGWNSLLTGFSGVWHYANITDFEYSYKIYTPIEGFKQNGIVAKLIFKEGLDFEVSMKLAEKRLGVTIISRPKPKILNELGIKTPLFHGNFEDNNAEGDDDFEEVEDPINWTVYVEVDSMLYPIIKCSFDVDQKGNLYVLQGTLTLPSGAIEFKDEFDFADVLNINNKLYFTTPYVYFKEATIITNVDIVIGYQYKLGFDVDYQNRTKTISMGSSLIYFLEEDDTEMYHNLSVHIHSPYAKLQKFDILAQFVRKDDNYRLNSNLATSNAQVFIDVDGTLNQKLWNATVITKINTPLISIPETKIDLLNEFTNSQHKIHVQFDMKRNKPTKINLLAVWKYESVTNLKGSLMLETPIKNLEKTEFDILFVKKDNKGQGNLRLVLHPINVIANVTIRDNELQSWITSEFNNERRIITAKCEVKEMSPIKRKVQGMIIMNDKEYEVSGSINLLKDGWPKDAEIQIKPYGGTPLNLQYLAKQWSKNDIVITTRLSQHLTFISLETSIKSKLKDHWDVRAQVNTSNERYPSFTFNSEITYADIIKGISMDIHTPFEGMENTNFGIEYSILGIKRKAHLKYQVNGANGDVEGEWCWILMENMQIKLINNYETLNSTERSILELYYINPNQTLTDLRIGGYGNAKELWKVNTDLNVSIISIQNLNFKGNFMLPNLEEHNLVGKFLSNNKWNNINYLFNYTTSHTNKTYGSSGKIDYSNPNQFNGLIDVKWDENLVQNLLNWKKQNKNIDVHYKLHTPKYKDEYTLVTDVNYDYIQQHHIICHTYYPASRAVVKAKIDFQQIANMNGTIDLITPFKKFEYVNSEFITQTSGIVYNRYIKASWPNNTAYIDSKCNTLIGTSTLERDTTGILLIEIPLTTRHIGKIDYKYTEKPNKCTGWATVDYNNNQILKTKYDKQSESRAGIEKDIVHVEAENSLRPIGITYIHGYQYSLPREDYNTPTTDSKHIEVFDLHNRTGFNVTGEVVLQTTFTGQEIFVTAIHSNRTIKFSSNYDVEGQQFKQHSRIELAPTVWVSYDLNVINKTEDESSDCQQIEVNLSYPGRSFTSSGSYNITDNEIMSEFFMVWDEQKRNMEAVLNWKRDPSPHYNRQQVELEIKHPSFEKNISLLGEYETSGNKLLDFRLTVDYSRNSEQKLELGCLLEDNSDSFSSNYTYKISGSHPATKLHLDSHGEVFWKSKWYSTKHLLDYKRTYLPLQSREAFGKVDLTNKEIEFKKKSLRELSYLWAKYIPHFPLYVANLSAIHGKDINATGKFYLNFKKKLIQLELNVTEDGRQSAHMYGAIPDARNIFFDFWRNYDDTSISDISSYLRLNHSRLIVASLKWRPEIKSDIKDSIRTMGIEIYKDILEKIDYWKQYIQSETTDAITDVWQDAQPNIQHFLNDLEQLKTIEDDIEDLRRYLHEAYTANDFYIRDVIDYFLMFIDELSIKSQIEYLPKIFNEISEIMGASSEEIQKRIKWVIETIKTYYKRTFEFVNGLVQGNALEYLSEALSKVFEDYDNFVKELHVSFIRYIELLWKQTYTMVANNWYKMLTAIEPTVIKLLHYLETIVWNASEDFLDFLYNRRNEIIQSPYFGKFASLSRDVDKLYKDLHGNSTLSTMYRYSQLAWKFVNEKYLKSIPFSRELEDILIEIKNELKELRNLPNVEYLHEKCEQIYENLSWFVTYFDIEYRIEKFLSLIYLKFTDLSQTALEVENRYRTAKTKFVFEPSDGIIYLEQKLPVSWHAFNETPKLQEIPEYKAINDLQNYFVTSKTNFWNLYYDYKPYTDPADWFPPFKAQAMLLGLNNYVTFDRTYYNFNGGCTYLLAKDFIDRNFSIAMSYDATKRNNNELMLIINSTVVKININDDVVKVGEATISRLPLQVGNLYLYQELGVVTVDSESGFVLQCNMKFDVCILELSGWYFGKTAGLWGTMNNEPSDDLLTSSGKKVKRNDIDSFAQSWVLDETCSSLTRQTIQKHNSSEEVKALCDIFFRSKVSPFVACFPRVSNIPFLAMCLGSSSEREVCTSAVAYMNLCAVENTPLRIPDACVKCNLLNGSTVPEGEFIRFEGDAVPRSTDVVFIVEAKECNKDLKSKRNIDTLVDLMNKELTDLNVTNNRYSVVTFGGNGVFDLPRSIVVNGNNFADYRSIKSYFRNMPIGNGNTDIFAAIVFATKLVFLPGVSKTFVLLPCSDCREASMKFDYAILHQLLIENDITLHILMNEEFGFRKSRVNKIFFGMDRNYAYTKNDVRELKGDRDLLGQVRKPKSTLGVCMSFAKDTNGSIFTAKKLETDKKNAVKRFCTVFAKKVAQSALPRKCQICECTAPNTGLAYMECFPCHYPVFSAIEMDFNEDDTLAVMQPMDEEEFDYSEE